MPYVNRLEQVLSILNYEQAKQLRSKGLLVKAIQTFAAEHGDDDLVQECDVELNRVRLLIAQSRYVQIDLPPFLTETQKANCNELLERVPPGRYQSVMLYFSKAFTQQAFEAGTDPVVALSAIIKFEADRNPVD
jgi:hypothetical protein